MLDDYGVKPRSDAEIGELARKARVEFGLADVLRVDPIVCLKRDSIKTVFGEKRLIFRVLPDAELGHDDASTSYGLSSDGRSFVKIVLKESVYREAWLGLGRARMTLAHELGHAIMHQGVRMARRSVGNLRYASIAIYESAEHQARVFGAALLIPPEFADKFHSDEEISVEFGVSIDAAKIYLDQRQARSARRENGRRMRQFADEFSETVSPSNTNLHFLDATCLICNRRTLFSVGQKFMCKTCDTVFDRLQDGDPNFD
jgi:Zn-dependent peptidase ImmA (M78 family)